MDWPDRRRLYAWATAGPYVDHFLPEYTVSHSRRQLTSLPAPWEPHRPRLRPCSTVPWESAKEQHTISGLLLLLYEHCCSYWLLTAPDVLHSMSVRIQKTLTSAVIYSVSRGECAGFRENVPYVKVHRYNPKHLYPKLNGYGDNSERKVWSSCGSMYCTCFACCYSYTAHVHPSVSQPRQAHSAFIINRCHSYSEL